MKSHTLDYWRREWALRTWWGRLQLAFEPIGIAVVLVITAPAWLPLLLAGAVWRALPPTHKDVISNE